MSIFNKKTITLSVIVIVILTIFFVFRNSNNNIANTETPYYKDLVLEKIYLDNDNSVYSLKKGEIYQNGEKIKSNSDKSEKVLRVALFYQWMKEDPLFFSSTVDSKNTGDSVQRLKNIQDEFLKKHNWQGNILAVDFLKRFIEASKSYQNLSNDVSEKNAGQLIQDIEGTNNAYPEEAVSLKKIIDDIASNKSLNKKTYASLGGDNSTNLNIISSDLGKIKGNSVLVGKEIANRKKCLFDSWKFCQRPMEKFTKPDPLITGTDDNPILLSKLELNLDDNLNYLGPYKINSPCWKGEKEQYLYVSKSCPDNLGYCMELSVLATDRYFEKLGALRQSYEYLKNNRVEAFPLKATNPYTCFNMEYQPKLATVNYAFTIFKNERLYKNIKTEKNFNKLPEELKKIVTEGEKYENLFFDAQYPSDDSLEYLANFYGFTYSYLVKNVSENPMKEKFLQRYLLVKEKVIDLDMLLNKINSTFSGYSKTSDFSRLPPAKDYVYTMRSGYSLLFLNFSSAVWRSNQKLEYLNNYNKNITKDDPSQIIMDYQTAISKYGKEKLLEWIRISREYLKTHNHL